MAAAVCRRRRSLNFAGSSCVFASTRWPLCGRIELYCRDEVEAGRLPKLSYLVLREVVLAGEIERGRVPAIIGLQERAARNVTSALLQKKLLVSESSRAPLRLGFPAETVERWFPSLYPTTGV
jgi:hypothetical protein